MASYGLTATSAPPTATSDSLGSSDSGSSDSGSSGSGSSGSGATHTVIVAPTQGVLRYIPFALNASVGDTIEFIWGANEHTVTKSSELTPSSLSFHNSTSSQSTLSQCTPLCSTHSRRQHQHCLMPPAIECHHSPIPFPSTVTPPAY